MSRTRKPTHASWLHFDSTLGLLCVTNVGGETRHYRQGPRLESAGPWHATITFAGVVIGCDNEAGLRALPEKIVVRRMAESDPVFCRPLKGARDERIEFIRCG
jgi:hypothetical protein